jgi:hypothetical protein
MEGQPEFLFDPPPLDSRRISVNIRYALGAALAVAFSLASTQLLAFHNGGLVQLSNHQFTWTDPVSEGTISLVEEVFEGCQGVDPTGLPFFNPHDMTFVYVVANQTYDPQPGITNGFSGFQLIFNQPIPELYNQQSPAVGGPWVQNAFSGQFPPWGAEWDVPFGPPNFGIMPGQIGIFSFCTAERLDIIVNSPPENPIGQGPNGWAHTWFGGQAFIFNGPNSIPDDLWEFLAEECSDDSHIVCKKVKYLDEDRDGIIEVGEQVTFLEVIQVHNPSSDTWTMTRVEDRWGAEIDVEVRPLFNNPPAPTTAALVTQGKSAKEFLYWTIGTLAPGSTVNLVLDAKTDLNPAGRQEYTSPGVYEFNSGTAGGQRAASEEL